MSDLRPFFKVSDTFADHPKFIALDDDAAGFMIMAMWGYCRHMNTDGLIPKAKAHRITKSANVARCQKGIRVGLLEEEGEYYRCHDYLDHQQSSEQRQAKSLQAQAAGRAGGLAKGKRSAKRSASEPLSSPASGIEAEVEVEVEVEKRKNTAATAADLPRDDVEKLCAYFSAALTQNSIKHTVTAQWRTDARLMLDRDKRDPHEIRAVIDWATQDSFWRVNVHSVPTLRAKYDRLRLAMQGGRRSVGTGIASQPDEAYNDLGVFGRGA